MPVGRFRFRPANFLFGEREQFSPRQQVQGELDDRQPDASLIGPVQRELVQTGVLGGADPDLAAGAAAVPTFDILPVLAHVVFADCGQSKTGGIGEPQLRSGVRALFSDNHSHPCRPRLEVEEAGCPVPVADLLGGVDDDRAGTVKNGRQDRDHRVGESDPIWGSSRFQWNTTPGC